MSADCNNIKCSECKIVFTKNSSLYAHLRKAHAIEPILKKNEPKVACDFCSKLFCSKSSRNKHIKNIHKNESDGINSKPQNRLICPHNTCVEKFPNYRRLHLHLNDVHSIETEIEDIEFNSITDFEKWKDEVQRKTLSFYSLGTAAKELCSGVKKQYLNCHRSFTYKPKGNNIRSLKSTGSCKIGKACPSHMEVTITSSSVKVKFWKTHYGHSFQLGHTVLDKQSRAEIAGKLKAGVSFSHILDWIRDNKDNQIGSNQRISLIERKDLHNIIRDYNIDYSTKRHQNDAISVKLWVTEMQALKEESPVLYYKGQGEEDVETALHESDFVLIIMSVFQSQQLTKFGINKICVDGTHGTNSYDIQLYTVMTVDEFGSGCPVAYAFSNRSDEYIFSLYFTKLKEKVGSITAKVFMSDDAPAFYNAWSSVMGDVEHKLLCVWHIDRNWRFNLKKIRGGPEKKVLVYKTLRVLLEITSVDEFHAGLESTLKYLFEDEDTKHFGEYFQNHYAYRPESWAYCYRLGVGINTNMYLESFHKVLKHIYLEGRKIKRLDKTISAVMKIARDMLFKRLIKLTKNTMTVKNHRIAASHKLSCNINSDNISTIDDNEWLVCSSDVSKKYHVSFKQNTCSNKSCLKCNSCKICIHSFVCSCVDSVIKLNICKHIHACAQLKLGSSSRGNVTVENCNAEVDNLLDMCQRNATSTVHSNEQIVKKSELIIGLSNNVFITEENRVKIEKHLDKVIDILNTCDTISLETTENVNIQKKINNNVFIRRRKNRVKQMILKNPRLTKQQ